MANVMFDPQHCHLEAKDPRKGKDSCKRSKSEKTFKLPSERREFSTSTET
jgi:hypothetical protein